MTLARRFPLASPALLWGSAAVFTGVAIALLPVEITLLIGGVIAFAILCAITPLAALAALVVLAPLRTLIATESALRLPLDLGQLLLIVLFGVWILTRIAADRRLPRLIGSPLYLPIGLFVLVTGLTAFSAWSLGAWLSEWLKWVQALALVIFCLDRAQGRRWEGLVFALVCAASGNALLGIYQYFGGSGALHLLINGDHFRAFGTFGQPNPFGAYMGITAPIALAAALGYLLRAWSAYRVTRAIAGAALLAALFYAAAGALISGALVLSYSRGAWLGFGAALGVLVFAAPRRWWHGLIAVSAIAAVVGALWLSGRLPASIVERIRSATEDTFATSDVRGVDITPANYAVIERLAHWQAAINMAEAHPWLGVGFGNYEAAYPQFRLLNWEFALGHAHNYYLNLLAETGLIGLIGYLLLWIGVVICTWRARQHPDPLARLIVAGALAAWTYIAAHSLTDNVYVNNLFLQVGLVFGLVGVIYNQTWKYDRLPHLSIHLPRMP